MKRFRLIALACCFGLLLSVAAPQDGGLGKGKGKGGGGQSGGSAPPPPPREEKKKEDPRPSNPKPREESRPPQNSGGGDSGIGKPRGGRGGSGGSDSGRNDSGSGGNSGSGTIIIPPPQGDSGRGGRGNTGDGGLQGGNRGVRESRESRSGRVQYGTVSNSSPNSNRPFSVDRAPIDVRNGSLEYQVRRQERVTVTRPYRHGYVHYDSRWRDDDFCYPFYSFTPVYDRVVVSPWYYYPHLPGYIVINRIQPINYGVWRWQGTPYNWRGRTWNDNYWGANDLDVALDDLVTAFERRDSRALGRLIPRRGRVSIALEGNYGYSLDVDDFYDMLSDAMWSTRTVRYQIEDVRTWRDSATVLARHDYTDPWGRRTTVYHSIRLESDRGGYVIRDFGTSNRRDW